TACVSTLSLHDALPISAAVKPINLALQGGGSHGAFTWGVLDGLLEDGRVDFDGICGTSAGAMNAVLVAHGLMHGGADGARATLRSEEHTSELQSRENLV